MSLKRSPLRSLTLPIAAIAVAVFLALFLRGRDAPVADAQTVKGVLTSRPRPEISAPTPLVVGSELRTGVGERRRVSLPDGSVLYVNENSVARLDSKKTLALSAGEIYLESAGTGLAVRAANMEVSGKQASFAVRVEKQGPAIGVTRGKVSVQGVKWSSVQAGQILAAGAAKPAPAPRASHALAWLRDLVCAAEAPLLPANPQAGGALVAVDPNGQEARLTLRRFHVDVHIEDGFARTTIDQTYFNHHSEQLEGTFYFPLPPDASLSRLAMYVNGQLMEGGMAERSHARNVYETIRYARRDPALLEWVDGSTFKMRVFPLEPRQEKRIALSYSQRLPVLYGQMTYRFPAGHTLQKVGDWSFHGRIKDGAGWAWDSPSHKLQTREENKDLLLFGSAKDAATNRDVVLTLADPRITDPTDEVVQFSTAEHEGARYLMTRFRPKLAGKMAAHRHDWVFLVETSGDRDPLLARVQIEVLRHLLTYAEADDTFTVLAANTRVKALSKEPLPVTPENISAAIAFLEGAHLIGALDLGRALTEAADFLKHGTDPYLVHLGSGIAAMGERRDDVLAKRIPQGTTYVGVGVGRRWARSLMKAAAERTGGHFTQINPDEPIAWRAFDLLATINTPRLTDVEVRDKAGQARFLAFNQAVAQGEEIAAVARVAGDEPLPAAVVVKGTLEGKSFERVLPVKFAKPQANYLPRTWAKLEIDRLLAEDAAKHQETIIGLSKAMYVITPFTSLLVLENEDQYTQYKVDRGRKDHWALYPLAEKIPVIVEPDPDAPDALQAKGGKLPAKAVLKTIAARWRTGGDGKKEERKGEMMFRNSGPVVNLVDNSEGFDKLPIAGIPSQALVPPDGIMLAAGQLGNGRTVMPVGDLFLGTDLSAEAREMPRLEKATALRLFGPGATTPAAVSKTPSMVKLLGNTREDVSKLMDEMARASLVSIGGEGRFGAELGLQTPVLFQRGPNGPGAPAIGTPPFNPYSNLLSRNTPIGMGSGHMHSVRPALAPAPFSDKGVTTSHAPSRNLLPLSWYKLEPAKPAKPAKLQAEGDSFLDLVWQMQWMPQRGRTYERPTYHPQADVFHDLVAYAPGLHTSYADVLGVLDAEAIPGMWNSPGKIDPAARELVNGVRLSGWHALTFPAEAGMPAVTIAFDDAGRFAYDRVLAFGLRERVVCDGKMLTHLYPQLALASSRVANRFHRADLAAMVPWYLPPVEELARGASLTLVNERTVAIVPNGVAALKKDADGKMPSYYVVHLVLGQGGKLAERQLVEMPAGKIITRQTLSAGGTARLLDGEDKELSVTKATLAPAQAPSMTTDTKDLLVLPLPYRSSQHVAKALKLEKRGTADLTLKEALPLFLAYTAEGNGNAADQLFRQVFHAREQRQLGFYVLLASCGVNLDSDHGNVLAEHLDHPLAQYLALHTSPVLRKHASQWAVGSGSWQDGALQHLAVTHALLQRWQTPKILKGDPARGAAETQRAIDYVRKNSDSLFGWSLLCLMQDRAEEDRTLHAKLAELWPLFENRPGLGFAAKYETARSLWRAGKKDEARLRFRALYEAALRDGALPAVDGDLRAALQAGDAWGDLMRQTARKLVADKRRVAVLALARQCWDLDDQPLAGELLTMAVDGIADPDERSAMSLAAFGFLRDTGQLPEADQLLQRLLADPKLARQSLLWRLAHDLAKSRDMSARAVECLEKALDIEAEQPPEVIDLQSVREDYGALLEHYQKLADAMVALKLAPPPDFVSRVIRGADRWRAVDSEVGAPCNQAARILQRLDQRELGWDYLTTPVALRVNESGPWLSLGETLARQGDLDLADRAYRAASESEPTNPQILWDRAQNLKQMGKHQDAQQLVRRIAGGTWQPRFQGLQAQARHLLKGD
jgi:tetratricopeptide (TPR) repeat protein